MKIEPGVLCYVLYANPENVDNILLPYNGSAIVEITAFAGKGDPNFGFLEDTNFWWFDIPGFGPAYAAEFLLQPIPPDELERIKNTRTPKEKETPA